MSETGPLPSEPGSSPSDAGAAAGSDQAQSPTTPPGGQSLKPKRTRASSAYAGIIGGLIVLIIIIIFIVQNPHTARIHFISADFSLPEGIMILIAAVAGGLVVLLVSLARVVQLRLQARHHRREHQRRTAAGAPPS